MIQLSRWPLRPVARPASQAGGNSPRPGSGVAHRVHQRGAKKHRGEWVAGGKEDRTEHQVAVNG